jgi:hypothetical protein
LVSDLNGGQRFEKQMRSRSGYKQLHKERAEFYVVGNVSNYMLSPYKVVFKELTEIFQGAVVDPLHAGVFEGQPIIPDHKMLFIDCKREEEAYFLAGVLNSIPARCALYSASVGVQTQSYYPPDISRIRLSAFDPQSKTVALPTKNGVKQNRSTPEETCTVTGVLRSRSFYPPLVPPRDP